MSAEPVVPAPPETASDRRKLMLAIHRVGRACDNGGQIVGSDMRTILVAVDAQAREIAGLRYSRETMAQLLAADIRDLRVSLEVAERERDRAREQLRTAIALAGEPAPYIPTRTVASTFIPDSEGAL